MGQILCGSVHQNQGFFIKKNIREVLVIQLTTVTAYFQYDIMLCGSLFYVMLRFLLLVPICRYLRVCTTMPECFISSQLLWYVIWLVINGLLSQGYFFTSESGMYLTAEQTVHSVS